tara:strand:+ start:25 stop:948 length:924 start_codon:yes stop_codon:yes gene_type:complete
MANFKPYPKKQKDISMSQQKAFDKQRGNPNSKANPNVSQTGIDFNRSTKMNFKGDKTKQFSVGIKDIDEAVFFYFNNVIRPFVFQNGDRREVPIIYGAPERWKSFQRDGYYRDKDGAVMLPIIVIKRSVITKDRSTYNKLDANQPNLYASFQKNYNAKNSYSNFNALNNRIPVKQFKTIAVPDFLSITYNCIIQTYYMEQLNKVIESIEYASDAYWGDPERFRFKALIDSFTTATELTTGRDRLVKGTFDINLRGYIIPDVIQKDLNSIKKYNSKAKVTITSETVTNINNVNSPTNYQNPNSEGRTR